MSHLVFIDTETTSLRPDRRAWEIGLIYRGAGGPDVNWRAFVVREDLNLGDADPYALQVGRFYERHPDFASDYSDVPSTELLVLLEVERVTRGAHLVGAVVNFDADVLATRMRAHGLCPSWHYHLIDVEALAVGYLAGSGIAAPPGLPWDSHELSRACGVEPPGEEHRHTALGDANWARDLYDAVMRWQQLPAPAAEALEERH